MTSAQIHTHKDRCAYAKSQASTTEVRMKDRQGITIDAVFEALLFIEENWGDWEGEFEEFMANVIYDDRVTTHDVKHLLDAIAKGEPIDGLEGLEAQKKGSKYKINYNPQ
jgi:hypothetical protein